VKGLNDLPISAQGLPASGWPARRIFYPPSLWRTGGLARRLSGGIARLGHGLLN